MSGGGRQPGGLTVWLSQRERSKRQGGSGREEALGSAVVEEGVLWAGSGAPLRRQTQDQPGCLGMLRVALRSQGTQWWFCCLIWGC